MRPPVALSAGNFGDFSRRWLNQRMRHNVRGAASSAGATSSGRGSFFDRVKVSGNALLVPVCKFHRTHTSALYFRFLNASKHPSLILSYRMLSDAAQKLWRETFTLKRSAALKIGKNQSRKGALFLSRKIGENIHN